MMLLALASAAAILLWMLGRVVVGIPRRTFSSPEPVRESVPSIGSLSVVEAVTPMTLLPPQARVPPGSSVVVQSRPVSGGLLFRGPEMPGGSGFSLTSPDPSAAEGPQQWLVPGKRFEEVDILFAMLYFEDLERRALLEPSTAGEEELEQIAGEVRGLLELCADQHTLRRQATEFLEFIHLDPRPWLSPPPDVSARGETGHLALRKGLARMAAEGQPIPASWAFAWVCSREDFIARVPATRCPEEFQQLFCFKYAAASGAGVVVKPNKTTVRGRYLSTNFALRREFVRSWPELPDITVLKQPIERLLTLANAAQDRLDAYSRFVGRNPERSLGPAAISLLPPELITENAMGVLSALGNLLDNRVIGEEFVTLSYSELFAAWPQLPENPGRKDSVVIAQCLERIGYGVEPDLRFGAHPIEGHGAVVIFRLNGGPTAPSPEYVNATVYAHLGAVVAHADREVSAAEEWHLMQHAAHGLGLTPPETRRLQAYLTWLLQEPPDLSGMRKRLDALSPGVRAEIGSFLATLAGADGRISAQEVALISRMYRLLGLDPRMAFSDLHAAAAAPVRMTWLDSAPTVAFRIPPRPATALAAGAAVSRVDLHKVQAMHEESERVAILLRGIFAEDDQPPPVIEPAAAFAGLDAAHSALLRRLAGQPEWSRESFSLTAAELGLLPDGAIDTINELALDMAGELLLEGDDPVTVNLTLQEELTR